MTRLEIATLACKILALWLLAQVVTDLSSIVALTVIIVSRIFGGQLPRWEDFEGPLIEGIFWLAQAAIGLFFWFKARQIAERMVSDDPSVVTGTNFTQENAMAVAFSAVGMFTLVPALKAVTRYAIEIFSGAYSFSRLWGSANWEADFWSAVLGLAVSLWLIFGSRGIVRVVMWARISAMSRGGEVYCLKCGYDIRATPDRCPECGTVPPKKVLSSQ
ncbi:MAG: hypothetical protein ABSF29_15325 [Tepidisphaeraceae bacterium]|jgi:hypothetical protein